MRTELRTDDFERQLKRVRDAAAGELAGVFGPASLTWRVDREAALFLGGGRALLLQLAHPWVAAGVAEHSRTLVDPIGRFHQTFDIMFTLTFGSLEQALAAARRLHRRHAAVRGSLPEAAGVFARGSPYWANEISALQWVHATLIETALVAHDLVLPPLTAEERERYYAESRWLGALFGLSPDDLPQNWEAFAAYNEAMWHSDALCVGASARQLAAQVLGGAGLWLRVPAWYRALTSHLLPEPLRAAFDLPYGEHEQRKADRARKWLKRVYPMLPTRLRHVGPYHEAMARLAGRPKPDLVTRGLNRLWIGRATMAPAEASHAE
jgi:uncharacterized protein (DUF2236 family)